MNNIHERVVNAIANGDDWFPIETAPRDGKQVIVNAPQLESESTYAYFENNAWYLAYDGKPFGIHVTQPTHWKPLDGATLIKMLMERERNEHAR